MAVRRPPAPVATGGAVNFGDDNFYQGGLGLPEGDYAMTFHSQMFQPTKQSGQPSGSPFLCVMLTAYPIDANGTLLAEAQEHPLSCGRKAHESFVPSADGKGFDPVPGGPAVGMNDMTNWSIFRKSLRDCGLPDGILTNDLTVLDGLWAHTRNVPEPEGRKELRSATGEAALMGGQQQDNRTRMIPVVTEIKANGKPWEGTGGVPAEAPAAPAAPAARRAPAAAARAAAPVAPVTAGPRRIAPVAVAAEPEGNGAMTMEELMALTLDGLTDFLVVPANSNGVTKIALRGGGFTAIAKKYGDDAAQAAMETFFADDKALDSVINQLGYRVFGPKVIVMPA